MDRSGQNIDRYALIETLGRGGMAVVYRAYDTRLERDVALKLIRMEAFPKEDHERVLKRFDREAHALAKLSHPGIVRVHDYGEHDGAPYLVMEYLGGRTLKEREEKRLPAARAAELLMPVAEALAYAHGQGILHRDVKPSNILLNDVGEAVLTDFGIAKVLEGNEEQTLTGTGVGVGTPEYMAPEQGLGGEVDGRADVYSLGVVLYELVTGEKPYTAETPMAVVIKQINDPLPGPRSKVPELPVSAERVLLKALAKKPEHRYQDMAAFAAALLRVVNGEEEQDTEYTPAADLEPDYQSGQFIASESETFDLLEVPPEYRRSGRNAISGAGHVVSKKPARVWLFGVFILAVAAAGWWLVNMGKINSTVDVAVSSEEAAVVLIDAEPEETLLEGGDMGVSAENVDQMPATSTVMATITETPIRPLDIGSQIRSDIDGMVQVYIPAGAFLMGSTEEDPDADEDEFPQREIYLDTYWIDQTEVTNSMYERCVRQGACTPPSDSTSHDRSRYYGLSEYGSYPVINITWMQAEEYCSWADRRLPTEAEWEKAAGGVGNRYPWGPDILTERVANFCDVNCRYGWGTNSLDDGYADTSPVGSYPSGSGIYGALDMAGNVGEWVSDWYDPDYYLSVSGNNPQGPGSGASKIVRGGSWYDSQEMLRVTDRNMNSPNNAWFNLGFRCASSVDDEGIDP